MKKVYTATGHYWVLGKCKLCKDGERKYVNKDKLCEQHVKQQQK